jgi:hypothetical protein
MVDPPSSPWVKSTVREESPLVTLTSVGVLGVVAGVTLGVADNILEALPMPTAFSACNDTKYVVPLVNPVMVTSVVDVCGGLKAVNAPPFNE